SLSLRVLRASVVKSLALEEGDHQLVDALRGVILDPVAGVGDVLDAEVGDPAIEALAEVDAEVAVFVAPDEERGAGDRGRLAHGLARVAAEEAAVVVDRGGEGA